MLPAELVGVAACAVKLRVEFVVAAFGQIPLPPLFARFADAPRDVPQFRAGFVNVAHFADGFFARFHGAALAPFGHLAQFRLHLLQFAGDFFAALLGKSRDFFQVGAQLALQLLQLADIAFRQLLFQFPQVFFHFGELPVAPLDLRVGALAQLLKQRAQVLAVRAAVLGRIFSPRRGRFFGRIFGLGRLPGGPPVAVLAGARLPLTAQNLGFSLIYALFVGQKGAHRPPERGLIRGRGGAGRGVAALAHVAGRVDTGKCALAARAVSGYTPPNSANPILRH